MHERRKVTPWARGRAALTPVFDGWDLPRVLKLGGVGWMLGAEAGIRARSSATQSPQGTIPPGSSICYGVSTAGRPMVPVVRAY